MLKEQFTRKWKFDHDHLTLIQLESFGFHKMFLELHSKKIVQHSPKQMK